MSKMVDERVVSLQFNNQQFEKNTKESMKTIESLNKSIEKNANSSSFNGMTSGLETLSARFSAMGAIGFTIMQNLTNSAINTGKSILNAITGPMIEGGKRRALNIEQAKFQFKGLGMDVEATMADASYAVDGTSYSLDAAAKVASQLGASGMRAGEEMRNSLRAISGVAAMAGSSYEDIGNVFTKVAGQGRVMGDDLLRLSSRGINAAATIANEIGKTEKEVREMVTQGKMDFQTFADAMDSAFGEHATAANETFTGSLANVKSALGRIGADVAASGMASLIGVFNALRPKINEVHKALGPVIELINGFIDSIASWATDKINDFDVSTLTNIMEFLLSVAGKVGIFISDISTAIGHVLGGTLPGVISMISHIITQATNILRIIKEAFHNIFPSTSTEQIASIINNFTDLIQKISLSSESGDKLRRVFEGIFSVISLVKDGIGLLIGVFSESASATAPLGEILLDIAAKIGDFFTTLKNAADKTDLFGAALKFACDVIAVLKDVTTGSISAIKNFVDGFRKTDGIEEFGEKTSILEKIISKIADGLRFAGDMIQKAGSIIKKVLKWIGEAIGEFVSGFTAGDGLSLLNGGLLAGLLIGLKKLMKSFDGFVGKLDGMVVSIKSILDGVRGCLEAYQQNLKANVILKLAAAIGILAVSLLILSGIDGQKLVASLAAIGALLAELFVAMKLFETSSKGNMKGMAQLTASMVILSVALVILSVALKNISEIPFTSLVKALGGIALAIGLFVVAGQKLQNIKGFSKVAASLAIMSGALLVLSKAVNSFGNMDMKAMFQGLIGVAIAIGLLVAAANLMPKSFGVSAVGLVTMSAALLVMSKAVQSFGKLDTPVLVKGLQGIAMSLLVMVAAMNLLPKDMMAKSVGMVILASALLIMSNAIQNMGGMTWEELAKGLITLASSLFIIVGAMMLMQGALPGAAALLIISAALAIFVPLLLTLGNMSWGQIGKGLLMLAATFTIIGVAGLLLTPLVPVLIGLGAAIVLLGVGVLACAAAVSLFAVGLTMLVGIAGSIPAVLTALGVGLLSLIPILAVALVEGITSFSVAILASMPKIMNAIGALLDGLIKLMAVNIPKFVKAFISGLDDLLKAVVEHAPSIIASFTTLLGMLLQSAVSFVPELTDAGLKIIVGFLTGIRNNIKDVITVAGELIAEFLKGLGEASASIIQGAFDMLIIFMNGLADAIRKNTPEIMAAGLNIASALIDGIITGIARGLGGLISSFKNAIGSMVQAGKDEAKIKSPSRVTALMGYQLMQGLEKGILAGSSLPVNTIKKVTKDVMNVLAEAYGETIPTTLMDSMIEINNTMIDSMKAVVEEAESLKETTAEAYKEAVAAQKALIKNQKGNNKTTNNTEKEARSNLKQWEEEQKITKKRERLQKAVDKAEDNAATRKKRKELQKAVNDAKNGSQAKQAAQKKLDAFEKAQDIKVKKAQKKLDVFDKQQAKNSLKAERKALKADIALAKKQDKADKKAADTAVKKAKKEKEAAAKEVKRVAQAKKKLEAYTKNTIVPLEKELDKAAERHKLLTAEIDEARETAAKAREEMNSYKDSIKQTFVSAASLTAVNNARTAKQYLEGLQDTLEESLKFEENIKKLADMGLSQKAIDDIISQGVESGSATAQYLLDGADAATIKTINDSMKNIEDAGDRLGGTLADKFYLAGVQSAEGIVKGLESQMVTLERTMNDLANKLAASFKHAMGIKSPSVVMKKLAVFVGKGLIEGLQSTEDAIKKTARDLAEDMYSTMGSILDGDFDYEPVFTPIVDLDATKRDLETLNKIANIELEKARKASQNIPTATSSEVKHENQNNYESTTVNNNFYDRVATPQEVYNASRFGTRRL